MAFGNILVFTGTQRSFSPLFSRWHNIDDVSIVVIGIGIGVIISHHISTELVQIIVIVINVIVDIND